MKPGAPRILGNPGTSEERTSARLGLQASGSSSRGAAGYAETNSVDYLLNVRKRTPNY
jgi:hypothetical protein